MVEPPSVPSKTGTIRADDPRLRSFLYGDEPRSSKVGLVIVGGLILLILAIGGYLLYAYLKFKPPFTDPSGRKIEILDE